MVLPFIPPAPSVDQSTRLPRARRTPGVCWLRTSRSWALGLLLTGAVTGCAAPQGGAAAGGLFGATNATAQQQQPEVVVNAPAAPTKEQSATTLVRYGEMMEQRGQVPEARKNYSKAIELCPRLVEAHVGLARLDYSAGRVPEAQNRLQDVLKSSPRSPLALAAMGQLHAEQGHWGEAVEYIQQAINADPDNKNYTFQLAVALAKSGQVDQSVAFFTRAVGEAAGHHNIGVILFDEGNLPGAQHHAQLALQKDPNLTDAQELLDTIQGTQVGANAQPKGRELAARTVAAPVIRPANSAVGEKTPWSGRPAQTVSFKPQHSGPQNPSDQNRPDLPSIRGQVTDNRRAAPKMRIRSSASNAIGTDVASNWDDRATAAPQPPSIGTDSLWQPMPTASSLSRGRGAQ